MNKFGRSPATSLNQGSTVISIRDLNWWKPMLGFQNVYRIILLLFVNRSWVISFYFCNFWSISNVFISRKVIECKNKSHARVQNTPAMFFILVLWVVMDKTLTLVHRLPKWTTPKIKIIPNEYYLISSKLQV